MRIPDGDLVPARRRRYSGGYGRSRRRRTRRFFAVVAVLLLAGSGVVWALQRDNGKPDSLATGSTCPTPSPTTTASPAPLPAPAHVRFTLLNGTPRNGLAQQVGAALAARGFVLLSTGNASAAVAGPSVITYGPGGAPAATVLARNVRGARVVSAPRARAGSLQLVLGADFRRLATPAEVAAAATTSTGAAVVPAPTRTPCPA